MKKNLLLRHITLMTFIIFTLTACNNSNKTKPDTVVNIPSAATSKDIQKELSATPSSSEENASSGISAETYDSLDFAGYKGKISFYYDKNGSVIYYKWFLTEADENKAKEIYQNVCEALKGSYGKGEESNSAASNMYTTTFTNEKQQIVAQLQGGDSGYEISYMVAG